MNKIVRPVDGRMVGGVCAGIAQASNLDVSIIRLLWILFILCGGAGFLIYLIAWAIIPSEM
jgi:phage shock protein C